MSQPVRLGLAALAAAYLVPLQGAFGFDSPQPLSGDQVQIVLLGNTLIDAGGAISMYYPTAGTIWGRSGSGDVDVGRWWIENDSYCRSWRRWFDAEIRCWQLALGGDDSLFWYSLDGSLTGRSLVRPGNAIAELTSPGAPSSQFAQSAETLSSGLDVSAAQVATARGDEVASDQNLRSERPDSEPPADVADQMPGPGPAASRSAPPPSATATSAIAETSIAAIGSTFTFNAEPAGEDSMSSRESAPPAEPEPAPAPEPEATSSVGGISYGREAMGAVVESAKNGGGQAGADNRDGGSGRD